MNTDLGDDGIDRIYVSLPSWALYGLVLRTAVLDDPMALSNNGISDHAPVEALIEQRA